MDWYVVDKKYINYLTQFDSRVEYVYLLQKEKALIDNVQETLQCKALKLYQKCIAKPDSSLATRCCNFKMLEEKCSSYSDT